MEGVFDFLHIKRNTAGSSNELSFDVLEQKSVEADGGSSRGAKAVIGRPTGSVAKASNGSRGSYHGVTGTSTLSGQAEVEKRKKARQSNRMRARALAACVVVVVVAVGAFMLFGIHNAKEDQTERIGKLVERVNQADETILEIDALMLDPFDEAKEGDRVKALSAIPKITTELNRVSVDAQTLGGLPLDNDSKVMVDQLAKTAQARNGMLAAAAEAFRVSAEVAGLEKEANQVWNGVLDADQKAREAVAAANKATTQDATAQALDQTRQALGSFETTRSELEAMSTLYDISFAPQEAYLSKRVEALERSVETSEALLAGSRDAAVAANEAYNVADAEAAKLAQDLPPSLGGIVRGRFERGMENQKERYQDARARAIDADAVIRQYLK